MGAGRDYEERRLAELIVYVANRLIGDPRFGATKLNKVLFFADFAAYRRIGKSITGAVYQHLDQGPCPHQVLPAIKSLGPDVVWRETETYAGNQRQLIALRPADTTLFSGPEIAIVEEVIEQLRGLTNQQVSDLSHDTVGYRITSTYDEIPYGSAVLSQAEPDDDDRVWLEEVTGRAGLAPATS